MNTLNQTIIIDLAIADFCEDQTTVEVLAQSSERELETFYVQTHNGKYNTQLGCWLTTSASCGQIDQDDFLNFDFDLIIDCAEEFLELQAGDLIKKGLIVSGEVDTNTSEIKGVHSLDSQGYAIGFGCDEYDEEEMLTFYKNKGVL